MVATYAALGVKATAGVILTVLPLTSTIPAIAGPFCLVTVKVEALSDAFVIASENVAVIEEFVDIPFPLFAGEVADTVGGVVSEKMPVVKFQLKSAAIAFFDKSLAAVVTVTVN